MCIAACRTLDNGAVVIVQETSSIPSVSINATFLAGSLYEPDNLPGLAYLTSRVIDRGTTRRNAETIASSSRGFSNAGAFGVIACSSMTPELLDKEIAATQALTQKPFGVNLITMHPALDELVQLGVGMALLRTRRLPSDASIPAESR